MIRDTTHWHAIAVGQRDVQKGRRFLRVLEKHFVKIAEPKQQECVRRNAFPQPLVLLHHRSKRVLHNGILPCQSQLNLNRRTACDFLLEMELNTIANALQRLLDSEGAQKGEIYTESTSKELIWADLTGSAPPSTLPLTDLQYFLKRGE